MIKFVAKNILITSMLGAVLLNYVYADNIPSQAATQLIPSVDNKKAGEMFLMTNKFKPDVITLADGLEYKVIVGGNGAKPKDNDVVIVDYEGRLVDGTVFDSSYKRGEPVSFPVNGVIPGWREALKLMRIGATWELYIPSGLAYGETGASPVIGPNETLIFKVHLIGIKHTV